MAPDIYAALWQWLPALGLGLLENIRISILAILLGTVAGLLVGVMAVSPNGLLRRLARLWVQLFRNAPWLVLVYCSTYLFPYELALGDTYITFPDWFKVTVGLALPVSANIAEIYRGAIASIPVTQWEAARSLAFGRGQVIRFIILPQCFKRMLPPWMNLYAVVTMGTSLASLVGVQDLVDTAQIASNTVNHTGFTVLVYLIVLSLFFVYCYPISRLTRRLERRYAF